MIAPRLVSLTLPEAGGVARHGIPFAVSRHPARGAGDLLL
jgi:hypothetical protein